MWRFSQSAFWSQAIWRDRQITSDNGSVAAFTFVVDTFHGDFGRCGFNRQSSRPLNPLALGGSQSPLLNGNKRAAIVSILVFLDRHNLVLESTQDELFG